MPSFTLPDHFSAFDDPRQHCKVLYPLPEVLLSVLCGTMAGADDFVEIRKWCVQMLSFLRRFLTYEYGIPSHDTLHGAEPRRPISFLILRPALFSKIIE
jgi:hypothetical protein